MANATPPSLPDPGGEVEYVEALEDLFLVIRKQGLMLSPADRDCVRSWFLEGIPLRIAAQSIVDEIDQFREKKPDGTPVPHAISAFSGAVHRAWKTASEQQFKSQISEDMPQEDDVVSLEKNELIERIEVKGKSEQHPDIREAYRSLYKRLRRWEKARQTTNLGHWKGVLIEFEVLLIQEVLDSLPEDEKQQINAAVQQRFHLEKRGLGAKAKAACLFKIQADILRQEYGLIDL